MQCPDREDDRADDQVRWGVLSQAKAAATTHGQFQTRRARFAKPAIAIMVAARQNENRQYEDQKVREDQVSQSNSMVVVMRVQTTTVVPSPADATAPEDTVPGRRHRAMRGVELRAGLEVICLGVAGVGNDECCDDWR
jgi:hypothetical protein